MGVDCRFYVVHGIKLDGYNAKLVDSWYDYLDLHGDKEITIIPDIMGGEYVVIGNILYSAEENDYDGDGFKELPPLHELTKMEDEFKEKFKEKFPDFKDLMDKPFDLFAFLHFS